MCTCIHCETEIGVLDWQDHWEKCPNHPARLAILKVLKGLDTGDKYTGPCFCEHAIGNPMYSEHSGPCKAARKLIKKLSKEWGSR